MQISLIEAFFGIGKELRHLKKKNYSFKHIYLLIFMYSKIWNEKTYSHHNMHTIWWKCLVYIHSITKYNLCLLYKVNHNSFGLKTEIIFFEAKA